MMKAKDVIKIGLNLGCAACTAASSVARPFVAALFYV
jgi:hypothetical protein